MWTFGAGKEARADMLDSLDFQKINAITLLAFRAQSLHLAFFDSFADLCMRWPGYILYTISISLNVRYNIIQNKYPFLSSEVYAWVARIAASHTEVHHIQLDDFGDQDAPGVVPISGIDRVRWGT